MIRMPEIRKNKLKKFYSAIKEWGSENMREFPWRRTSDPYRILIAEMMLHRTRADQVAKIFDEFVGKYPDFRSICMTGENELLGDLSSLGLRWRVRNISELSCKITQKYGGKIPLKKEELVKLPGIGEYTASAFLCFSINRSEPLLDTNTVRVLGRVFGLPVSDTSRRSQKFRTLMIGILEAGGSCREFSFSLIDFADAVCRPAEPDCENCPVSDICTFYGG